MRELGQAEKGNTLNVLIEMALPFFANNGINPRN